MINVVKDLWNGNGEYYGRRIQEALNFDPPVLVYRAVAAVSKMENRTGCVLSRSSSSLTVLHWDGIIRLRCCPHSPNGPVGSCGIESEML